MFIMTVPTPIDSCKRPDLSPLENVSATVGRALKARGDLSISKGRPLPHRFRQHVGVEQNVHASPPDGWSDRQNAIAQDAHHLTTLGAD